MSNKLKTQHLLSSLELIKKNTKEKFWPATYMCFWGGFPYSCADQILMTIFSLHKDQFLVLYLFLFCN